MAKTPKKEQVGDGLNSSSAPEKLRRYVENWERLESDKKAIADEQKDLMGEAKAEGFDTKIIRKVIMLRKMDKQKVAEENAVLDLYLSALGMDFDYSEDDNTGSMV